MARCAVATAVADIDAEAVAALGALFDALPDGVDLPGVVRLASVYVDLRRTHGEDVWRRMVWRLAWADACAA